MKKQQSFSDCCFFIHLCQGLYASIGTISSPLFVLLCICLYIYKAISSIKINLYYEKAFFSAKYISYVCNFSKKFIKSGLFLQDYPLLYNKGGYPDAIHSTFSRLTRQSSR